MLKLTTTEIICDPGECLLKFTVGIIIRLRELKNSNLGYEFYDHLVHLASKAGSLYKSALNASSDSCFENLVSSALDCIKEARVELKVVKYTTHLNPLVIDRLIQESETIESMFTMLKPELIIKH